jgi:co-chaperonin GroES (HSP10)
MTMKAWEAQDPAKFEPHGDRYLLQKIEVDAVRYYHGHKIFLAGSNEEYDRGWELGKVIAKGDGHRMEIDFRAPMPYEINDIVYVERLTGRVVKLQGEEYWLVNQVDILGRAPDLPDLMRLQSLDADPQARAS